MPCCLQTPVGNPPGLTGRSCPSTRQQNGWKAGVSQGGQGGSVLSSHRLSVPAAASDGQQVRDPGCFLDR